MPIGWCGNSTAPWAYRTVMTTHQVLQGGFTNMPAFEPYPVSQTPFVPERRANPSDVVMTCLLIALHIAGFLLVFYVSLFWGMATDSCTEQTCNYDNITLAVMLSDLVGGIVVLSTSTTAVLLMAFKRTAFWAPLLGIVVQVILVLMSLIALDGVS